MITPRCPLCDGSSTRFFEDKKRLFFQCEKCKGVFADSATHPAPEQEIVRYREHNNDVNDARYQAFVAPIVNSVFNDFTPQHRGLDFGSGTGPVISSLLRERNYQITQYDPFFANFPERLETKYDYIVCCEVIEHFHHPHREFALLKNLLLPGGKLYCMTEIFSEQYQFAKWHYKNDMTHVFFYHAETFRLIKDLFRFSEVKMQERLIVFKY